jgi:hypothetical protein
VTTQDRRNPSLRRPAPRDALNAMAAKRTESPYRSPRGNPEPDQDAVDRSIEAFVSVLGR